MIGAMRRAGSGEMVGEESGKRRDGLRGEREAG